MARKINYKEVTSELEKMVKPMPSSRKPVGFDKNIGEYYFIDSTDLIPFKNQARKYFNEEEILSLSESIKKHGIRQPLTIIPSTLEKGKFEVISGERRLKAANLINIKKLPCIILDDHSHVEEIAIVENVHRQDLHPIELGDALKKLLKDNVFNSNREIAEKLSLRDSKVSELLKLSELDQEIKNHLIEKNIKTRDILRKAVKYLLRPEIIKNFLGINAIPQKSFSILRIRFEDNEFKLQQSGLKHLKEKERQQLKIKLQEFLKDL